MVGLDWSKRSSKTKKETTQKKQELLESNLKDKAVRKGSKEVLEYFEKSKQAKLSEY